MSQETNNSLETNDLIDDIEYINEANKVEIRRIENQFRSRIAEAGLEANSARSIIEEVSVELGQLSTKVELATLAINSISKKRKLNPKTITKEETDSRREADVEYKAEQLAGNRNLLPVEFSPNGISYLWSGSNPETQLTFSLDRNKPLGMQIRLFALIKPEFLKKLKVLVDGTQIRHSYHVDEALYVVSCNLPKLAKSKRTEITIVLPATHSPSDLGISTDGRKLGIAISAIRFGKTSRQLDNFFKRLKLKS